MVDYEVIHEILNLCPGNQMRDVFIEEIQQMCIRDSYHGGQGTHSAGYGGGSKSLCERGENGYLNWQILSEIQLLTKGYNIDYTFYMVDVISFCFGRK